MSNYIKDLILLIVFYLLSVNCMRASPLANFSKRYSINSVFRQNALYFKNTTKEHKRQSPVITRNNKRTKKIDIYQTYENN